MSKHNYKPNLTTNTVNTDDVIASTIDTTVISAPITWKRVKFNITTVVNMTDDVTFAKRKEDIAKLKYAEGGFKRLGEMLITGMGVEFQTVYPGDVLEVPGWYYDANKDKDVTLPVSFGSFKSGGGIRMFDMKEFTQSIQYKLENEQPLTKLEAEIDRKVKAGEPCTTYKAKLFDLVD